MNSSNTDQASISLIVPLWKPNPAHQVVSGEGQTGPDETSPTTDRVAESFDGTGFGGEIEAAAGFNASRAASEGLPFHAADSYDDLKPAEASAYAQPETVCGADDRVRISPANAAPWRFICQLIITMPNGAGYRGTGWFIGPRAVMTAGHCVFSRADGGWARRIEVISGMDATGQRLRVTGILYGAQCLQAQTVDMF
jgi:glutamyl endopeptidase